MSFKIEKNPFGKDFIGIFISRDGGETGLFISEDENFTEDKVNEYETLGEYKEFNDGKGIIKVVEVFG